MPFIQRRVLAALITAAAAWLGAACTQTTCAQNEVEKDGACVLPCNNRADCVRDQVCVDGYCTTANAGSGSSGGGASSAASGAGSAATSSASSGPVSSGTSTAVGSSSASGASSREPVASSTVATASSGPVVSSGATASSAGASSAAGPSSTAVSSATSTMPAGMDGSPCVSNAQCLSGHCTLDLGTALDVCAPANQCAWNGVFHPAGWFQCAADGRTAHACDVEGNWGPALASPAPNPQFCTVAGESRGGFQPAAACVSGNDDGGFVLQGCTSCAPYLADSTTACFQECAGDDDSACRADHHCWSADDACYPDATGQANRCDVNAECTSGRCAFNRCINPRPDGDVCSSGTQCAGNTCSNGICCSGGTCCDPTADMPQCGAYACNATTFSCRTQCDNNNDAYCAAGNHCYSGTASCHPGTDGAPCDRDGECNGLVCSSNACTTRPITSIRVTCTSTGGGGGPFTWSRVDETGTILQALSPVADSALYSTFTTPSDLTLGTSIQPGWYFAVTGGEGSGPLTCTFTFRTGAGMFFDEESVTTVGGGTNFIVRDSAMPDTYTRFRHEGSSVSFMEHVRP